jgi:hypothetical protein
MAQPTEASMSALATFGRAWLLTLGAASVAAIGANLVFGIPLASVVDVLLALVFCALAVLELYFLGRAIAALLTGRMQAALLWLGAMAVYILLLCPPMLAFTVYASLMHQPLTGASSLYDSVADGFEAVFKLPIQLISAALVLMLNSGSGYVNYLKEVKTGLEIAANGVSILVALQSLRLRRRHEDDEEAH